jgi:uncharacterized surface protein with fasciclin (FAS1) repeats
LHEEATAVNSILETAWADDRLGTFSTLVEASGLKGILGGREVLTAFAPSDEAFEAIPTEDLAALAQDRNRLADAIRLHVARGRVRAEDLRTAAGRHGVRTLQGSEIAVDRDPGTDTVFLDAARVVEADIECTNGILHIIDAVLLPRALESIPR